MCAGAGRVGGCNLSGLDVLRRFCSGTGGLCVTVDTLFFFSFSFHVRMTSSGVGNECEQNLNMSDQLCVNQRRKANSTTIAACKSDAVVLRLSLSCHTLEEEVPLTRRQNGDERFCLVFNFINTLEMNMPLTRFSNFANANDLFHGSLFHF